jgi:hypothetical protein
VIGSTLRHRAGRDGDSEHLGDGRIVKAVLHFADGPDHAMLGRARVGSGLYQGQRMAVDAYLKATGESVLLNRIDYSCRLGVKRSYAVVANRLGAT